MCGIVGILGGELENLGSANDLLGHRGPDDSGIFKNTEEGVGLAHRRLSIQDLSSLGHQPMFSEDKSVVLVFNGEIYNFKALRKRLIEGGLKFRGNSDTEVLLNLYMLDGEAMLSQLNGIFAFALWDSRKRALFVARDALGVKPLYYSQSGNRFAFASELKALLYVVPEARELDVESLHRYLSFLWCPGAGTPLRGVRKLGPGEALWVREGKIEKHLHWYQLPGFRGASVDFHKQDAIDGVEFYLRQAVERQMVSDVPVGAFLSGGLDSSSIVAFARERNTNIQCFTIDASGGPEEGSVDDLPYARLVAKHLGVPLAEVSISPNRMAGDLIRMVSQLDEPLADPGALNVLYISQMAREQGIKVLLSGAGGDDIFTGYRRHRAVHAEKYWSWLPNGVRSQISRLGGELDQRRPLFRRLRKLLDGIALDGDLRLANYFLWAREADILNLYTEEAKAQLLGVLAVDPMLEFLKPVKKRNTSIEKILLLEQRFFLADHNLNYTDKMSMATGVEVRVPFLDLDLVEYASKIPASFKQHGKEGKWVLKKSMERYLPRSVIYRPKTGFGAPLRRWMTHDLRGLLGDVLSTTNLVRRGLFDPKKIEALISANDNGKIDASYTLLSLLCIEVWCGEYLDRNP